MMSEHLKDSCRKRKVVCDLCKETISQEDLEDHKVKCSQQVVECEVECDDQVDHTSLSEQLDEAGSKSKTTYDKQYGKKSEMCVCEKCMKEVKSEDRDFHLKEKCLMREVQCVFCDSVVQEYSLAKHYDICDTAIVRCGNKCGVKISRKDLSEHYRNECPKTLIACEHCEEKFERQLLEDHHEECVKFPIPCPESCDVVVAREDVERHLGEECQKLFSACAYKEMKCSYEGFPAGMTQHVKEEMPLHMDLIKSILENFQMQFESEMKRNEEIKGKVKNLEMQLESERKINEELRREIKELRKVSFLWKVEDIAEEIEKAKNDCYLKIYSPHFYSSKHGYKLRLMLYPDSDRTDCKGNLGIYIQIMPGEYDSILEWPFTKLVTFKLVDQATDGKDIVKSVRGFYDECFSKPKDGKCNEKGRGFPRFVSHELLNSRSYIVDNAIFLEVSVEE